MNEHKLAWGLLPEDVYQLIHKREWSSISAIKKRLSGQKPFPIKIGLKPPSGNEALADYSHLEAFLSQWKTFEHQNLLTWKVLNYRHIGQQEIPAFLVIDSVKTLVQYLGKDAQNKMQQWEQKMRPVIKIDPALAAACIAELDTLDSMRQADCDALAQLLPQLKAGMGKGLYLRALPVTQVHTKFIETYQTIITRCLDSLTNNQVSETGGLMPWLSCTPKPVGWLLVRPLCPKTQKALGSIPILKMPQHDLLHFDFPCNTIIVVENESAGLSLPDMADTVAVFGGGANISWLASEYLTNKQILYWGDIDSYGFKYLSDARQLCPQIQSIMMDEATILAFQHYMSNDKFFDGAMPGLTPEEFTVCTALRDNKYANTRLEQEFIAQDFVQYMFEPYKRDAGVGSCLLPFRGMRRTIPVRCLD